MSSKGWIFRLPMLVFSPIISVRLSSLHLSVEGLGMGALCVFAPLRALREDKTEV
jgi:hypothetical protein